MIPKFAKLTKRFIRSEDGNGTVEFAITFPAMLMFMLLGPAPIHFF